VKTIIAGGTVVSSEGECQTDVLVDGVRIVAVGLDLRVTKPRSWMPQAPT